MNRAGRPVMLALCFGVSVGKFLAAQTPASNACPLPSLTNGEITTLHGTVKYGAHDLLFMTVGCSDAVVLEDAGGLASAKATADPVQNDAMRRFRKYVGSFYRKVGNGICGTCPKYKVEASLMGKIDVASDTIPPGQRKDKVGFLHDGQSGRIAGQAGFGHPPAYKYRLVIRSVSELKVRKLPKPKLPAPDSADSPGLPLQ